MTRHSEMITELADQSLQLPARLIGKRAHYQLIFQSLVANMKKMSQEADGYSDSELLNLDEELEDDSR